MENLNTEQLLIMMSGVVVLSYLFSIVSNRLKVPSVLLLLFSGIALRYAGEQYGFNYALPRSLVEGLGVVGLIMIVLEAGLDLKLSRKKLPLIKSSFTSALVILVLSLAGITGLLKWWLNEPWLQCIVYATPLSVISSAIVIPSLHHLTAAKKEFLVYEASFSDIIGIILFNYFIAGELLTLKSIGFFGGSIIVSIIFSVILSVLLFLLLANTKLNIKFFLIFSLLILLYAAGKLLHLPSLLMILVFGLMINNWEYVKLPAFLGKYSMHQVESIREFMHSITAETSFLIRTFFFILFGYTIQLQAIFERDVILIGSMVVAILFVTRILYLRFFLRTNLFPEAFFMPRGLITIVLFYKIPGTLQLSSFNESIIAFVILATGFIMTIGILFYKKKPEAVQEELLFQPQ